MNTFVIVGASLAGAKAAETLRDEGFDGRIVLIGEEPERPYERPPLSKAFLMGKEPKEKVYVHPPNWYADHDVELLLGAKAVALDASRRLLTLDAEETLSYDKLLLTTGSVVRPLALPGVDFDQILYLRRLADSERIAATLTKDTRLLIVGAGWIGLEVAAAAREVGATVTVVEFAPLPLQRVLGDEVAPLFADLHRSHGVDLRTGTGVRDLRGAGRLERAVLSDGDEIDIDAVVVGIGVAPAVDLAVSAGLAVENGVLTDEHLRTSDENIFAAGDVANSFNPLYGKRIRVEHWANALAGGPAAARSMLGKDSVYDPVPYFYSDQYDFGMEYAGYVEPGGYDQVVFRGEVSSGEYIAFWLSGGRLLAGMNVNVWDVTDPIQAIIRAGRPVDVDKLTDPSVPLEELAQT